MTLREALRVLAGALAVTLVMALATGAMLSLRIEQFALDLAKSRAERQAAAVARQVESAFQFGLTLPDMPQVPQALRQLGRADDSLMAAAVHDDHGQTLHVWQREGQRPAVARAPAIQTALAGLRPAWTRRLLDSKTPSTFARIDGPVQYVGQALTEPGGHRAGVVWLVFDRTPQRGVWAWVSWQALPATLGAALAAAAMVGGAALWLLRVARRRSVGLVPGSAR